MRVEVNGYEFEAHDKIEKIFVREFFETSHETTVSALLDELDDYESKPERKRANWAEIRVQWKGDAEPTTYLYPYWKQDAAGFYRIECMKDAAKTTWIGRVKKMNNRGEASAIAAIVMMVLTMTGMAVKDASTKPDDEEFDRTEIEEPVQPVRKAHK